MSARSCERMRSARSVDSAVTIRIHHGPVISAEPDHGDDHREQRRRGRAVKSALARTRTAPRDDERGAGREPDPAEPVGAARRRATSATAAAAGRGRARRPGARSARRRGRRAGSAGTARPRAATTRRRRPPRPRRRRRPCTRARPGTGCARRPGAVRHDDQVRAVERDPEAAGQRERPRKRAGSRGPGRPGARRCRSRRRRRCRGPGAGRGGAAARRRGGHAVHDCRRERPRASGATPEAQESGSISGRLPMRPGGPRTAGLVP